MAEGQMYLIFLLEFFVSYYKFVYQGIVWGEGNKYTTSPVKQSSQQKHPVLPYTKGQVEAIIIYVAYLLRSIDENMAFNYLSLSSYRIELYFAHLRQVCNNNNTPENIERCVQDDYLRRVLELQYQINNETTRQGKKRSSEFHSQNGGTKLDTDRIKYSIHTGRNMYEYVMAAEEQNPNFLQGQSDYSLTETFDRFMNFVKFIEIEQWEVVPGRIICSKLIDKLTMSGYNRQGRLALIMHAACISQNEVQFSDFLFED
ncbi:Conserved_hypothetical protein [Hexamita inflata]|uniref:Uncharacterized protein n=1 Tax=Hexamita inflata TaxID=28002 RepID=A0AA86QIY4_9EUKA|nr:Conserved hypothetical protein [Hexamita inflata]